MVLDFLRTSIYNLAMWQFLLIVGALAICLIFILYFILKPKKQKNINKIVAEKNVENETHKEKTGNINNKEALEQSNVDREPIDKKTGVKGKYTIDIKLDGYHFYLIANNGQLLFDNPGFTTPEGAERGIETFKSAVKEGKFRIYKDKYDRYRFILNKRYVGENYSSRKACESSVQSVKRFALDAVLTPYEPDLEMEKRFEEVKNSVKSYKDIDWEKVFASSKKSSGKFEIAKEDDGFHFYLIANNGQLLYSGNRYSSKSSLLNGLESFKKAVYVGNFYVDEDKFDRYRYILKGGTSSVTYLGESYTTKQSAVSSVESVKRFALSAVIKEIKEN